MQAQNIDLLSLSAHKFHGPKRGVGALYRSGIPAAYLPRRRRLGARVNGAAPKIYPLIAGWRGGFNRSLRKYGRPNRNVSAMRDMLIDFLSAIPHSRLNGNFETGLPGIVNFA